MSTMAWPPTRGLSRFAFQVRKSPTVESSPPLPTTLVNDMFVRNWPFRQHPVGSGAVLDDLREVVAPLRPRHAERLEEALLAEVVERLARHSLHHHAQQGEGGVVVEELVARLEVQLLVAAHQLEDLVHRVDRAGGGAARQRQHRPLAAQAARVVQEVADEDRRPEVGELRHVLPHRVVERQLAVERQQHDGGRGELLGDRAGLEDRVRADPDAVLEVGHAVAVGVDDCPLVRHTDGAAWQSRADPTARRSCRSPPGSSRPASGACGACTGFWESANAPAVHTDSIITSTLAIVRRILSLPSLWG